MKLTAVLQKVREGYIGFVEELPGAVMADTRLPAGPEIPTVDEAGLPGLHFTVWQAIWAPRGTPTEVVTRLNAAVVESLSDPAVRKRLGDLGYELAPNEQQTPQALAALQKREIEKWWPMIKSAEIKLE